mmetsp:Transcript_129711/g.225345  ORF Transcript_129711/g.225345 Transcript_129711/m.225345 type:complete len:212 (-) Transcript_129711:328-963(-)
MVPHGSAPAVTMSAFVNSAWPASQAKCKGVMYSPLGPKTSTSTCSSSNCKRTETSPLAAASHNFAIMSFCFAGSILFHVFFLALAFCCPSLFLFSSSSIALCAASAACRLASSSAFFFCAAAFFFASSFFLAAVFLTIAFLASATGFSLCFSCSFLLSLSGITSTTSVCTTALLTVSVVALSSASPISVPSLVSSGASAADVSSFTTPDPE